MNVRAAFRAAPHFALQKTRVKVFQMLDFMALADGHGRQIDFYK